MKFKRGLWLAGSAAIHLAVMLLLLQALLSPRFFGFRSNAPSSVLVSERINFVVPSSPVVPDEADLSSGGALRRPPRPTSLPPAPTVIPGRVAAADPGAVPTVVGEPTRTTVDVGASTSAAPPATLPNFTDSRIWGGGAAAPPDSSLREPRVGLAGMKFVLDSAVKAQNDSIAALRDPTDWTVGEGAKKFGIDPKWVYLGPIKIPTMLLAFVPLNVQSNPNQRENGRTLGAMAAEVRSITANNGEVKSEIQAIRQRMERQRAAQQAAANQSSSSSKVPPPGH